jgi:hypothetical protein
MTFYEQCVVEVKSIVQFSFHISSPVISRMG